MSFVQGRPFWNTANLNSLSHKVSLVCFVATLSYLAARLGGTVVIRPQVDWPFWPGNVLLASVLLLVPRRIWPILIAAAFAMFALYNLQAGMPIRSIILLQVSDAVEVLTAAVGLSYSFEGVPQLDSVKALAKYSLFAVILAPFAGAFFGALATHGEYWTSWRISFLSEALGYLTLMPAILGWASKGSEWAHEALSRYLEAVALLAGLAVLGYFSFISPWRVVAPALTIVPFLLWSALRFGATGVSTVMIAVAFLSIWGAVHERGPFTGSEPLNNVMSLQLFLLFAATPFMVLAVLAEERRQAEQTLSESEKRFRLVADTAPALIWMAGTDKLCTYFNKPWLEFTGRSIDFELGNGWAEGVHTEDLRRCMDTYTQAFERREEFRMEYRLRRNDGEYRWVLDIGVPRFNQDRSFAGYIGIGVDVTERKAAEEALCESEDKLRLLLDSTAEGIYGVDLEGRCTFCNPACLRVLGYERVDELLGKNMHHLIHHTRPDGTLFPAEECRIFRAFRTGKGAQVDDEVLWRANGTSFPAEYWSYPQRKGQEVVGAVVAFVDITQRKQAENALANVSRRLMEAQEQERTRIARELHDDIGQRLSLLAVELEELHQNPPILPEIRSWMGRLQRQTSEIATDIQALSHELHSSKLEYLGMANATKCFCKEFSEQQDVEIDFRSHDLPSSLSPDISLCLFRVLQEALHNSAKHSGVRRFEVRLWGTSDEIHLTVSDSGAGFDLEAAKQSQGLGLISMEERLKLVKGTFSIESQPKRGTMIHACVPLSREATRAAG